MLKRLIYKLQYAFVLHDVGGYSWKDSWYCAGQQVEWFGMDEPPHSAAMEELSYGDS